MLIRALCRVAATCLVCGMIAGLAASGSGRAGDRFFSEISDLPVMPGLSAVRGVGVVFVKPEGRIVTILAKGNVARSAVLDYYGAALPQLGWTAAGPGRFRREGELLRLEFVDQPAGVAVKFALSPQ